MRRFLRRLICRVRGHRWGEWWQREHEMDLHIFYMPAEPHINFSRRCLRCFAIEQREDQP